MYLALFSLNVRIEPTKSIQKDRFTVAIRDNSPLCTPVFSDATSEIDQNCSIQAESRAYRAPRVLKSES